MGVILNLSNVAELVITFPHTRGGDPKLIDMGANRWTLFPTHVGVILRSFLFVRRNQAFPHTRGGDPIAKL